MIDHHHGGATRKIARAKLKKSLLVSLFIAIIFLLSFTPLGFIQLLFIKATSVHIPVILGGLLLGPGAGALLGFFFGLTSLISNTLNPSLLSCCFSPFIPIPGSDHGSLLALLICFLPRILCGFLPALLLKTVEQTRRGSKPPLSSGFLRGMGLAGGALGALVNTILVMGMIALFFSPAISQLKGLAGNAIMTYILSVVLANGLPEAGVAALFCAIALPLLRPHVGLVKTSPTET